MDAAVPTNERVPLDVLDVVLSHLQDVNTLRSCALVCSSWLPLTRPYLFRGVAYRPAIPSRTLKDLLAFLSRLPQSGRFVRSVTVNGATRNRARPRHELSVEEIAAALAQIPTATHITVRALQLTHPIPAIALDHSPSLHPSRSVEMVKIHDCIILQDALPFRGFLSRFACIDAIVLKDILVEATGQPVELPPVEVQLRCVFVRAVTVCGIGDSSVLRNMLDGLEAPSLSLSVSIAPRSGFLERIALNELLGPITQVHTLSVNVLSSSGSINWIIEDQRRYPPLRHSDVPREWVMLDLSRFSSLHTLVLYSTTTISMYRESATLLYAAILANNWRLLSNAPTSLRHIELRFQRYGPHSPETIDELRAIDVLEPSLVRWEAVDVGTLARFPDLESFTCVLCGGGFMEQWGPMKGLRATAKSGYSQRAEFDDYVALLRDVLPQLHAAGRLQFRMSDV
ncbi:hypothetical protein C8T65DRAFT_649865 [Cerioporus squamosus]|nr:hypothetical protein C8T65DRAFT_649865 [Cerioporus squamosus]